MFRGMKQRHCYLGFLGCRNGAPRVELTTNTNPDSSPDFHGLVTTDPIHPRGTLQSHGSSYHISRGAEKLLALELAIPNVGQILVIVRQKKLSLNLGRIFLLTAPRDLSTTANHCDASRVDREDMNGAEGTQSGHRATRSVASGLTTTASLREARQNHCPGGHTRGNVSFDSVETQIYAPRHGANRLSGMKNTLETPILEEHPR